MLHMYTSNDSRVDSIQHQGISIFQMSNKRTNSRQKVNVLYKNKYAWELGIHARRVHCARLMSHV